MSTSASAVERAAPSPAEAARAAPADGQALAHVVVYSSLFPSSVQPNAGLFIRERMFRCRGRFRLTVVAPTPWFPFQSLLRRFRPGFRPELPAAESSDGVQVLHPRFFSVPGIAKRLDGISMALCTLPTMRRIRAQQGLALIDSHFAYPDGYAAGWLGRWLSVPVTVTLRGTEARLAKVPRMRALVVAALRRASRIIAVSASLKQVAVGLGIDPGRIRVIGNGVDLRKFSRLPQSSCRSELGIAPEARVLISVGGLTERKGFHRVIDCLPGLIRKYPDLLYLAVGGPSAEGDWGPRLQAQVARLGLERHVRFTGPVAPERLKTLLSAADLFVLATANEGWANVFLEAMACGLPVVTTDVGGNREVVCSAALGTVVPFGDPQALAQAIEQGLNAHWDRAAIVRYAEENAWEKRMAALEEELGAAMDLPPAAVGADVSLADASGGEAARPGRSVA